MMYSQGHKLSLEQQWK